MKLNETIFSRIIGWLHTLILFWSFYPLTAVLLNTDQTSTRPFLAMGLLLLLPILISWYAVAKMKHLSACLLLSLLVSFAFGALNGVLGTVLGTGFYPPAVLAFLLSEVLFLIRCKVRIQKGALQRSFQELPSSSPERVDYKALEVPAFLDAPHPAHWGFLAIHYIVGALLKSSVYWHMIFYLFFADAFLYLAFQFTEGFSRFLRTHSHSANLPVKTMQKIVRIIFGIALVIFLLFTLPSLFYGKELLSGLTFQETPVSVQPPADIEASMQMSGMEDAMLPAEFSEVSTPKWLDSLFTVLLYLLIVACACVIFAILYRVCKNAGSYFSSETEDTITFLEKGADSDETHSIHKKRGALSAKQSINLRIRRYYKKTLRKNFKIPPKGAETPAELEAYAGFTGDEEQALLHACYEKARYSREGCTPEDSAKIKTLPG